MKKFIFDPRMKELGILVTSHPKQHLFMDQAFTSWRGFEGFMLLGYDHTDISDLPLERWKPPVTETFVTGQPAGTYGHHRGELWQMKLGAKLLAIRGYTYFYKTAADNGCFRWRNLSQIFKVMDQKHVDLVICGTTQIFGRLAVFNECMALWSDQIQHCGGAEIFLYHRIKDLGVRDLRMKVGWWNELLGLIHLQGEFALNTGISIVDTWAIGQKWGQWYPHTDLDPRVKFLQPHIKERYDSFRENSPAS